MTKQEQIEEIARLMCMNTSNSGDCERCGFKRRVEFGFIHQCFKYDDAETIYNTGYRKEDEVRKETAKEILQWLIDNASVNECIDLTVNEVKAWFREDYGVEVEE